MSGERLEGGATGATVDGGADGDASLLLVGDTNLQGRDRPADAFRHVLPALRAADLLFGQLEGPLAAPSADPAAPDIPHKAGWRHSDPAMVAGLVAAGFAAVSCASNVTYGARAIGESLATLDAAGIAHCGAGGDREAARRPAVVARRGVRFGFLGYTSVFWPVGHAAGPATPGVATVRATTAYQPGPRALEMPGAPPLVVTAPDPAELTAMEEDVRRLRAAVDIVVVSCHWGVSGSERVAEYQRAIGRAAIDAGADLVFGHHPHVLQAIEVWRGRPICYSLGNFAFDWAKMRGRHLDGLLVRALVRGRRLARVAVVPMHRDEENLIRLLDPATGAGRSIVERLRALATDDSPALTVEGGEVVVDLAGG